LTEYATEEEKTNGFDIADYLLRHPPPVQTITKIESVRKPIEPNPLNPQFDRIVNLLKWFAECGYIFDGTAVLFSGEVIHDVKQHIKDLHFQVEHHTNDSDLIKAVERLESIKSIMTDKR
jgi:hypothetical protein